MGSWATLPGYVWPTLKISHPRKTKIPRAEARQGGQNDKQERCRYSCRAFGVICVKNKKHACRPMTGLLWRPAGPLCPSSAKRVWKSRPRGINWTFPCYVSEKLNHGLILGRDFLRKHKARVDFSTRNCTNTKTNYALKLPKRQNIAAESQVVVIAEISGNVPDNLEGTIEGSAKLSKLNLMPAKVLACSRTNRVPIAVRNPHPYHISIFKGTKVGTFATHESGVEISNIDTPDNDNNSHVTPM